jgi:hypothetical protein
VARFNRNQWQLSTGISGNLRLESVAGFDRNQWQPSRGIRNTQQKDYRAARARTRGRNWLIVGAIVIIVAVIAAAMLR